MQKDSNHGSQHELTGELLSIVSQLRQVLDAWTLAGVRDLERGELAGLYPIEPMVRHLEPTVPRDRSSLFLRADTSPGLGISLSTKPPGSGAGEAAISRNVPHEETDPYTGGQQAPDLSKWKAHVRSTRRGIPRDMNRLRGHVEGCRRCGLAGSRHNLVFGQGNIHATLMIVGEAPGAHEDRAGLPFVGPAGQMLDRMLENVLFLKRADVFITNVLKCRPPGNRDPSQDEIATCLPFLEAQVQAVQPRAILSLGRISTQVLLGTGQPLGRLRGRWADYRGIPLLPTYHPAYLLRSPSEKRKVMQDLLELKSKLQGSV